VADRSLTALRLRAGLRFVAVLGLAVAAAATADDAGSAYPGFTLTPPAGDDWRQVQRNAASLVWMKRPHHPNATFSAAVLTGPTPTRFENREAFLAYVRRTKTHNPDPRRFQLRLEAFEPVSAPAANCARYRTAIVDLETARGGQQPLLFRVTGLACLHPDRPSRYFDVQYSSRAPRGIEPPDADLAAGEAFLSGFEFGPTPADDRWALGEGGEALPQREQT
jgi:hypothetical protein